MFMDTSHCCVFGGTRKEQSIMSSKNWSNGHKESLSRTNYPFKASIQQKMRGMERQTWPIHFNSLSVNLYRKRWMLWAVMSFPTRRTRQPLLITLCFGRWLMDFTGSASDFGEMNGRMECVKRLGILPTENPCFALKKGEDRVQRRK